MTDDELKRLMQENTAEVRRHFDVAMESNRHEIGLIAEKVIRIDEKVTRLDEKVTRLDEKVTRLDEKLDKTAANLAQRIEQTAAETQAMIKFSHAELDRRLRTVEENVSDLQARVERIESSTH